MKGSMLIALDGSQYSRAAVELGIHWCKESGSTLIGLTIVNWRVSQKRPETPSWYAQEFVDDVAQAQLAEAKARLQPCTEDFTRACGLARVGCDVIEEVGRPAQQILLEAQRTDLVLLGQHTHFHGEAREDSEGSLLRKVLQDAPRPVVIAPKSPITQGCVVVGCDGSPQASRALYALVASGLAMEDPVHILSIAETERESRCPANRATDFLGRHGIHAFADTVVSGEPPASVILRKCQEFNARLLVLGVSEKPRLQQFLFGSVAREILHSQDIPPLLMFH